MEDHETQTSTKKSVLQPKNWQFYFTLLFMLVLCILSWIPYVLSKNSELTKQIMMQQWGMMPGGQIYALVDTSSIVDLKKSHYLVLIARIVDPSVDESLDDRIEKSSPFEITGGAIELLFVASPSFMSRLSVPGLVREYLVEIPKNVSPSRIATLSNLESMGGRILGAGGYSAQVVVGAVPQTDQPSHPTKPNQKGKM